MGGTPPATGDAPGRSRETAGLPQIDGYALGVELGRGGMGAVYRATPDDGGDDVAIKVLHDFGLDGLKLEALRIRLAQEADILASLQHPSIVGFLGHTETVDGRPAIVLELVGGGGLGELLDSGSLDTGGALKTCIQICSGLAQAHRQGVIHRDIKPANILISEEGDALIADFGIAQIVDPNSAGYATLTSTNAYVGTAYYIAPEVLGDGAVATARSDVYSAGVLLYKLLTGEVPVGHFEPATKLLAQRGLRIDMRFDEVIERALARDPDDRYADAGEMLAELRFLQDTAPSALARPIPTRRTFMWLDLMWSVGAVLLGFVCLDAWLASFEAAPRMPLRLFDPGESLPFWAALWTLLLYLLLCNWPYRRWRYTEGLSLGRRLPIFLGFQPARIGPELTILSLWVVGIVQWVPPVLGLYHLMKFWQGSPVTTGHVLLSGAAVFVIYLPVLYWWRVVTVRRGG